MTSDVGVAALAKKFGASVFACHVITLGFLPPLVGAVSQEIIDLAAVLNALRITLPQDDMSDF